MYQGLPLMLVRLERAHYGRHLHEIWAGADDVKYVHDAPIEHSVF
jgi:hypothetical protein